MCEDSKSLFEKILISISKQILTKWLIRVLILKEPFRQRESQEPEKIITNKLISSRKIDFVEHHNCDWY